MLHTNKLRRLVIGIFVLIFVNVLWVASSELTKFIFDKEEFRRPFFTTYFKTSLFMVYLLGFVFHKPWRDQCFEIQNGVDPSAVTPAGFSDDGESPLGEPEYERLRRPSDCDSSEAGSGVVSDSESIVPDPVPNQTDISESDRRTSVSSSRSVRFKRTAEVRRLPQSEAEAAALSRLTYEAWLRWLHRQAVLKSKLPLRRIMKLALQFCFIWFLGNYAYQMALNATEPGIVNVLSSSSSFFTLLLAAIFPSCAGDKFTLSKLCVVFVSVGGVSLITWVDETTIEAGMPAGVAWALAGALAYAVYVVFLRRGAESEDRLDISMFFGFVGLFNTTILWPGFYVLHETNVESFYPLPNRTQILLIGLNGVFGTVVADLLWLWGCFLTSSLLATLAMSLSTPLSLVADAVFRHKHYPWQFKLGSVLITLAFVGASVLAHADNWDPIFVGLRQLAKYLALPCRKIRNRFRSSRMRLLDADQQRSLIGSEVT